MKLVNKHIKFNKFVASTKRRSQRLKRGARATTQRSPILWVLSGGFAGILIASSILMNFDFLQNLIPKQKLTAVNKDSTKKNQVVAKQKNLATTKAHSNTAKNAPIFDFYTVLPQMETTNTAKAVTKKVAQPVPTPVANKNTTKTYMIQVKTLDNIDAADELKAELAFAGFEAQIEHIQQHNQTWYRIVLGPFNTEQTAKLQQQALIKQNIYGSFIRH